MRAEGTDGLIGWIKGIWVGLRLNKKEDSDREKAGKVTG